MLPEEHQQCCRSGNGEVTVIFTHPEEVVECVLGCLDLAHRIPETYAMGERTTFDELAILAEQGYER